MNESGETSTMGFLIKAIIVGEECIEFVLFNSLNKSINVTETYNPTIGLEFESKEVDIQDESNIGVKQKMTLQIWDTAGQESFRSIVKTFYKNSAAVLLVYDVKKRETFERLPAWISEIKSNSHDEVIIVLIGNKHDNKDQQLKAYYAFSRYFLFRLPDSVDEREVDVLVNKEKLSKHIFTSAKENFNIDEAFQFVADEVYKRFIKDQTEFKNGVRSSRNLSVASNQAKQAQIKVDENQPQEVHKLSIKNNQNKQLNESTDQGIQQRLLSVPEKEPQAPQQKKCCSTI